MLYVIATPIGNLQDITFRAVEVLKKVEKIYCEDTRHSHLLLAHFGIETPTESFHQHSSSNKMLSIVDQLKNGADFAYISDAGTPGISDPVEKLVAVCFDVGITVVPIPGASAVTTLLSVSGVPADSFWFAGFVPTKKGRQTFLKKIISWSDTVVIFETAPRLLKLFGELNTFGYQGDLIIGRELTKQFEEISRGNIEELVKYFTDKKPRGEFVIVLSSKLS